MCIVTIKIWYASRDAEGCSLKRIGFQNRPIQRSFYLCRPCCGALVANGTAVWTGRALQSQAAGGWCANGALPNGPSYRAILSSLLVLCAVIENLKRPKTWQNDPTLIPFMSIPFRKCTWGYIAFTNLPFWAVDFSPSLE